MSLDKNKLSFIKRVFGSCTEGRDGLNVAVKCPACDKGSSKKKLEVRVSDGTFHCWVCGFKGRSLLTVLKKYNPSHINEHNKLYGKKTSTSSASNKKEVHEVISLPQGFSLLTKYANKKLIDPDVKDTIDYVRKRGLTIRDFWYYKLGTCTTGRFRRRVILPSFDGTGILNYYTARSIDSDIKMKYMNSKVSKTEIIFNEINLNWQKEMTLVEGPFDMVKCDDNSTCLLGSHLPVNSLLFQKLIQNKTPVVLALDPDAETKMHEIARNLSSYDVPVRVANISGFNDVGEMSKKQFLITKSTAKPWTTDYRLQSLISRIKSGSLL